MLKTGAEIAKLKGITRQAIRNYISKNHIEPAGMKGKYPTYDCIIEPLASYLAAAAKLPPPEQSVTSNTPITSLPQKKTAAVRRISKPLNDLMAEKMPKGYKPAEIFYAEAYKLAKQNNDATLYFKLAQIAAKEDADEALRLQALKTEQAKEQIAIEKANRLALENEIRRGQFMDKATVKLIFGKQYAVDTSVLMPLGLKLADTLDALPPGADRRNKIQKLIDDEIFSALETKKRILEGFIQFEENPA